MAEKLPLVVDVVIDAEEIFTHVDGQMLAAGRGIAYRWSDSSPREDSSRVEEQCVRIQQELPGIVLFGNGWPGTSIRPPGNAPSSFALKAGSRRDGHEDLMANVSQRTLRR